MACNLRPRRKLSQLVIEAAYERSGCRHLWPGGCHLAKKKAAHCSVNVAWPKLNDISDTESWLAISLTVTYLFEGGWRRSFRLAMAISSEMKAKTLKEKSKAGRKT